MNRESERKRLVELLYGSKLIHDALNNEGLAHHLIMQLADYMLDNGIVVPPVKVGDKVYKIFTKYSPFVSDYVVENYGIPIKNVFEHYEVIPFDEIGKTVFLTKEEAEKALERKEDESNA